MKSIFLKIVPKFVRKMVANAVMEEIRERTAKDSLVGYAVSGASWAIEKGTANVNDERLTGICNGCEIGGETLRLVALSCKPESDGGRKISPSEEDEIAKNLRVALDMLITDEMIERVCKAVEDRINSYLGV